jgi:hypothetical protein
MLRARRTALFGAAALCAVISASPAAAGFITLSLWAGAGGSSAPSSSDTLQFTNPSGSPLVAITQLPGGETVEAATAGGVTFFGPLGTPLTLDLTGGTAYLASSSAPAGAKPSDGLAPGAPQPGEVAAGAGLLGVTASAPAANGSQVLSVSITGAAGDVFGTGQVILPEGGWWVIGLTPEALTPPPPPPVDPGPVDPPVEPPPGQNPGPTPPTAATPEPATLALVGLGLPLVGIARLLRKRGRQPA